MLSLQLTEESLLQNSKCVQVSHGMHAVYCSLFATESSLQSVPRMLTDAIQVQEILELYNTDSTFLSRIVTGDETWVNHRVSV